ncbi:MAG: GGDEF domain-containing protein, partial [Rhodospirillaceae bacterium]|nr:GGDEF domain-containing protein [Rhodospirillaceae bacterium]
YFLIASVAAAISASITTVTVWGLIPYSLLGYRAIDIGVMIEAVLLALALADQFRISQHEKIQAVTLAMIDPLTGVNNRRAFFELVEPLWNTGVRHKHDMSVILLDVDKFKSINDTYGHALGDDALINVSRALKEDARAGDVLARWGGDEFILFLPETTYIDALYVAERIRSNISAHHFDLKEKTISFSASLGVSHTDQSISSLDGLITAADRYLYMAKEQGRNRVCWDLLSHKAINAVVNLHGETA